MKTDTAVASRDFKYNQGGYLARVQKGENFTITIHDRPVARLVPVTATLTAAEAVAEIRELRKGNKAGGKLREWINKGRR